ncbi:MAG: hypothetical protein K2J77_00490 [Oscillospiraceae bacterium]|nr:hypothetical protein [Oscillospiraceae bacterium]
MKNKFIGIMLLIIAVAWAVWSVFTGVTGLAKSGSELLSASSQKGTICETKVIFATEIFTVEHKMNFILPIGTEHYYFTMSEDGASPLLIKASREWYDKNFGADGMAKQPVTVKGEIQSHDARNYAKLSELNSKLQQIDKNVRVSQSVYLNSMYKTHYGMRLAMGLLSLSVGVAVLILMRSYRSGNLSGGAAKFLVIWMIVAVLGAIVLGFASNAV